MPRRLNRPRYGWSYTYGKEQRVPSDKYKSNFDLIKFKPLDTSKWATKKTRFGIARVKVYD